MNTAKPGSFAVLGISGGNRSLTVASKIAALLKGSAGSARAAEYQFFQIQEMLRLELLSGPLAGCLQLDAHEIADLPIDAVAHYASQLIAGTLYIHTRAYGHRYLELQAHPGWRDVFQQSGGFALAARRFFPTDVYHIRA
jgi:hypothetical protein